MVGAFFQNVGEDAENGGLNAKSVSVLDMDTAGVGVTEFMEEPEVNSTSITSGMGGIATQLNNRENTLNGMHDAITTEARQLLPDCLSDLPATS